MVRRSLQGPGHEPQKEVSITDASKVVEHPKKGGQHELHKA